MKSFKSIAPYLLLACGLLSLVWALFSHQLTQVSSLLTQNNWQFDNYHNLLLDDVIEFDQQGLLRVHLKGSSVFHANGLYEQTARLNASLKSGEQYQFSVHLKANWETSGNYLQTSPIELNLLPLNDAAKQASEDELAGLKKGYLYVSGMSREIISLTEQMLILDSKAGLYILYKG